MNQFFETSIVPSARPESHVRPEEQTTWKMSDDRLERRERAREIIRARNTGSHYRPRQTP